MKKENSLSWQTLTAVVLAAALVLLGFLFQITQTQAHEDPENCNASGLQQFPSIGPAGNTHVGNTLTYSIIYVNSDPDGAGPTAPCNITGADATITRPNGTIINVLTNASLPVGESISCPGDAECAAGPYTYVVNQADQNASSSVTTVFDVDGVLHQDADEETASDHDTLSKTVIHPSTVTTINSSATTTLSGGAVNLTVTEQNNGDTNLTGANVVVTNGTNTVTTLVAPPTSGDDGDGILEPGETWSWTVSNVAVNSNTTFTATGHGTDSTGKDITWCADQQNPGTNVICDQDERASVSVTLLNPSTITSINSSASQVVSGGTVNLTVTEQNNGDTNLTGANVVVDNGVGTLSSPPTSGDDADGILEPGETWSWTVSNVVISTSTTFTATGHGTVNGMDVTWCANPQTPGANILCDQEEQDSVTVNVLNPSTMVGITSSATTTLVGGMVNLTVTEQNNGDTNLTGANVVVDNGVGTLSAPPTSGDDGDGILEPGETWSWTVSNVVVNSDTTFTATGHGMANGMDVTWCANPQTPGANIICDQDERASVSVNSINPTTVVSITSSLASTTPGGMVNLTVTEQNDGDVNLTGANVVVTNGSTTVTTLVAPPTSGDDGDGILEPGETWSWTVSNVVVNSDTTFVATGHGTDPLGNDVTYPSDQQERDDVFVDIINVQGCSPGYWKQSQHFGSYPDGIYPNTLFVDVFGEDAFPGMTLLQVLSQGGGGLNALGRIIVGAYLNAASVNGFPYTTAQVIADFQAAFPGGDYNALKSKYEALQDPCPLGLNPGPASAPTSSSTQTVQAAAIVENNKGKALGKNK